MQHEKTNIEGRGRPFEIVIFTRDSARWIGTFLVAYRRLGLDPFYIVDSRSQDETIPILTSMGARCTAITPVFDRVEAMLGFIADLTQEKWVLRLDDDEFPSVALIAWLETSLEGTSKVSIAISRRDSMLQNRKLVYTKLRYFYFDKSDPSYLNPQWRVFQPKQVSYTFDIHTPGFEQNDYLYAPQGAFFVHFDWVIRSHAERLAKLERYEAQRKGAGSDFRQFYLPEMHTYDDLRLTAFEGSEFEMLAEALADLPTTTPVVIRSAPMVSYAQHYEDVRLARCFPGLTGGFYIDVGAWHPMLDSVTCHFYKRGWYGINVEPTPSAFALLQRYRSRDINLPCVLGDRSGEEIIHVVDGSGLSTTSAQYADRAQAAGLPVRSHSVPSRTLADVCAEFDPETIHFLKVDVEGDEPAVLSGHDWTRWRPWVVVVEGTEPNDPTRTDAACRPILAEAGYEHATFDGLNDFYVAAEHTELISRLQGPITPFEVAESMRERALSDVHRKGPLGQWLQSYQNVALTEALSRDPLEDVAAYQRHFAIAPEAKPADQEILHAYRIILGREADLESLDAWRTIVAGRGLCLRDFLKMLCSSDEYLTARLMAESYLQYSILPI